MKRFKFSLQQVLDMREQQEKAKSLDFVRAKTEYRKQNRKLQEIHQHLNDLLAKKQELRLGRLDRELLMMTEAYELREQEHAETQLHLVKETEKEMLASKEKLLIACRKKKILERLKEKDWEQYYRDFLSLEQKNLDEIGSLGFWRGKLK